MEDMITAKSAKKQDRNSTVSTDKHVRLATSLICVY